MEKTVSKNVALEKKSLHRAFSKVSQDKFKIIQYDPKEHKFWLCTYLCIIKIGVRR